ncbi:cleavage and polyadenylation specificity factor subunit 4-like [Styela clava]
MQAIVADVNNVVFDMEVAMEQQLGVQPLPFPGMDKSGASVCHFFKQNVCARGVNCPFRHVLGDKAVVCKHWLRGLCKKGDQCEFLHEYDMSKMPECYFYSKFGRCDNKDCQYQHIDPASKIKDCPWYDRGFCKHGPHCSKRHKRRVMCINYLIGFCPDGKKCKYTHPTWDLPTVEPKGAKCHICGEFGHKVATCPQNPYRTSEADTNKSMPNGIHATTPQFGGLVLHITRPNMTPSIPMPSSNLGAGILGAMPNTSLTGLSPTSVPRMRPMRDLSRVTCFKCGKKGHYANRCNEIASFPMPFLSKPAT